MKWRSCLWAGALATVAIAGIMAGAATINVPGDYATIQAAINNAASTGDTIVVAAGTYAGNVNVNKSVTLSGAAGAIVQQAGGYGFQVAAPNITITGFEIKGCATGIQTYGAPSVNYGTLTLRDTYVHNNTVNGMLVTDSLFATIAIENCRIVANSQNGIGISNKTKIEALNITDTTVDGNGGHGMFLANVAITSVDIQDSSFTNSSAYGMSGITLGTTASQIGAFLMQGGSLSGNRGAGLTVAQAASTFTSLTLDGVAITSNKESGILLGGGASAGSLTLDGCTFQGNAWEDVDLSGGWYGAFSVTGTTEIINNTFAAGPAWAAIYVGDAGAFGGQLYIAGNSFRPGWAIYSVNGKLIDAVNNWWGSASGANVVAYVTSSVVYSPWLANNTAAQTWVFIVDDVGPIGPTGYLKPALDWALDGDLVCIRTGRYGVPKVEIGEDYSILGAGAAGTVLVPTESAVGGGDAGAWFLVKAGVDTVLERGDARRDRCRRSSGHPNARQRKHYRQRD